MYSIEKMENTSSEKIKSTKEYIESLNDKEKLAYQIAQSHLGSAFRLDKSVGYLEWLQHQR